MSTNSHPEQDAEPKVVNGDTNQNVKTEVVILPGWHGNLNESQSESLKNFKIQIEKSFGLCDSNETWFDEITLLRFLRARKFNVEKAIEQFSSTDKWRKDFNLENLFKNAKAKDLFQSRKAYPRFLGRRDKQGKPIFVLRPGSINSERQKEIFSVDEKKRSERIAILTESLNRLWLPLSSDLLKSEHPVSEEESESKPRIISEVTSIVDLDGASFSMMWTLRNHLREASVLNSAHYPETLGTIAICNVPHFFTTIWGWVQKWFDEGTRKKMFIVDSQQIKQGKLKEIIHSKDLPKVYGGELEWKYEDEPDVEEEIINFIGGGKELPSGPAEWKDGKLVIFDPAEAEKFPHAILFSQQQQQQQQETANGDAK